MVVEDGSSQNLAQEPQLAEPTMETKREVGCRIKMDVDDQEGVVRVVVTFVDAAGLEYKAVAGQKGPGLVYSSERTLAREDRPQVVI